MEVFLVSDRLLRTRFIHLTLLRVVDLYPATLDDTLVNESRTPSRESRHYSYLSATIGSTLLARWAGR